MSDKICKWCGVTISKYKRRFKFCNAKHKTQYYLFDEKLSRWGVQVIKLRILDLQKK